MSITPEKKERTRMLKYNSTDNSNFAQVQSAAKITTYRFCQSLPKIKHTDNAGIFCNGRPLVGAHRNASREQRRQYNFQRARAIEFRLSELPHGHKIFRGALKMPGATEAQWRTAKNFFNKIKSRECNKHGWTIGFSGFQHIDISKRRGNDDLHYDFILFADIDRGARWIHDLILGWWKQAARKAGCNRITHSACKPWDEGHPMTLQQVVEYCCKFPPENTKSYHNFMETFPLPKCKLPCTWFSGFWSDDSFTTQSLFDGELRTQTSTGWRACYKRWLKSEYPNIPEFTTPHYRHQQAEMALQELGLMPAENEVQPSAAPITYYNNTFPHNISANTTFHTQITDLSSQINAGQNLQPERPTPSHFEDHSIQCIIPGSCWIVGLRDNPDSPKVSWICDTEGDLVLFHKSEYFNLLSENNWQQVSVRKLE